MPRLTGNVAMVTFLPIVHVRPMTQLPQKEAMVALSLNRERMPYALYREKLWMMACMRFSFDGPRI